ncbi:helix-turn-helix domain-containing protein [Methylobacterium sp. E-065]|uniref:YdaS family helix-turn-helix protein n=1 Tax=Methylobacterium sp. E-065 TaxID=2836583 RepID=UPI001FB9671E|nr:YdaS family helix-turn-helix protein [Methylobacterium sp. E-065]MCJ2022142.1 helix-turn-helix domain-containing protein [Methylobacterium sp. E-065]
MAARPRFKSTAEFVRASTAVRRAVAAAGGAAAVGQRLGISGAAVSQWVLCPPLRVLHVEAMSGVSRSELRPDMHPPADCADRPLTAEQAVSAHLAAGAHFALTGRCMSAEVSR